VSDPIEGANTNEDEPHVLVEPKLRAKASCRPRFQNNTTYHTRICRPIGLSGGGRATICNAMPSTASGSTTTSGTCIDLMRYLVPLPVPQRWRRSMIALVRAIRPRLICSALNRAGFRGTSVIRFLPKVTQLGKRGRPRREILEIRHSSLYAPRDFDISPYFTIVNRPC